MYKHIQKSEILELKNQVSYQPNQVSSKTISQNKHVSITLFSFDKDEEIGAHKSKGEAMVTILDGKAKVTIDDKDYFLEEGQTIVMPANIMHALYAVERFKMLLTVVFPAE